MQLTDLTLDRIVASISTLAIVATLIVLALTTHDPVVIGALVGAVSVGGGHAISASLRRPEPPPAPPVQPVAGVLLTTEPAVP